RTRRTQAYVEDDGDPVVRPAPPVAGTTARPQQRCLQHSLLAPSARTARWRHSGALPSGNRSPSRRLADDLSPDRWRTDSTCRNRPVTVAGPAESVASAGGRARTEPVGSIERHAAASVRSDVRSHAACRADPAG